MKHLVISTGLRNKGNSWAMGNHLCNWLESNEQQTELLALRNHDIPFCDGKTYLDDTRYFKTRLEDYEPNCQ